MGYGVLELIFQDCNIDNGIIVMVGGVAILLMIIVVDLCGDIEVM